MNVDPRHHGLDLRQIDVIVGVYLQLIAERSGLSALNKQRQTHRGRQSGSPPACALHQGGLCAVFFAFSGWFAFWPFEGGSEELLGVLGGED